MTRNQITLRKIRDMVELIALFEDTGDTFEQRQRLFLRQKLYFHFDSATLSISHIGYISLEKVRTTI